VSISSLVNHAVRQRRRRNGNQQLPDDQRRRRAHRQSDGDQRAAQQFPPRYPPATARAVPALVRRHVLHGHPCRRRSDLREVARHRHHPVGADQRETRIALHHERLLDLRPVRLHHHPGRGRKQRDVLGRPCRRRLEQQVTRDPPALPATGAKRARLPVWLVSICRAVLLTTSCFHSFLYASPPATNGPGVTKVIGASPVLPARLEGRRRGGRMSTLATAGHGDDPGRCSDVPEGGQARGDPALPSSRATSRDRCAGRRGRGEPSPFRLE
jgi:hypothetical protein